MTRLNKILVAALAAQLVLVAVVFASRDAATIPDLAPVLAGFEAAKVDRVEIVSRDHAAIDEEGPIDVAITRAGEGFVLASAYDYPADAQRVDELLSAVAAMQAREPIATSASRAQQLAVAEENFERKVVLAAEGKEPRTLYLGGPAGRGRIAVREQGRDEIFAVDSGVGRAARRDHHDWVPQPFFEVNRDEIATLSIENEHVEVELVRGEDGAWALDDQASTVRAPAGQLLDQGKVDAIARSVARIRLGDIAGAEPAAEHGLDEPAARVEIVLAAADDHAEDGMSVAERRFVLVFGADDGDHIYARDEARPFVVKIRSSAVRDLLRADEARLFATEEELARDDADEGAMPVELPTGHGTPMPGAPPGIPVP